jgi:antirestriction protein ArdC
VSRDVKELEAESVAYCVCADLGIDTSEYSFGYVATWAGGSQEARRQITASAQRIQKAAQLILGRPASSSEDVAA